MTQEHNEITWLRLPAEAALDDENRMASAVGMAPNQEYFTMGRGQ